MTVQPLHYMARQFGRVTPSSTNHKKESKVENKAKNNVREFTKYMNTNPTFTDFSKLGIDRDTANRKLSDESFRFSDSSDVVSTDVSQLDPSQQKELAIHLLLDQLSDGSKSARTLKENALDVFQGTDTLGSKAERLDELIKNALAKKSSWTPSEATRIVMLRELAQSLKPTPLTKGGMTLASYEPRSLVGTESSPGKSRDSKAVIDVLNTIMDRFFSHLSPEDQDSARKELEINYSNRYSEFDGFSPTKLATILSENPSLSFDEFLDRAGLSESFSDNLVQMATVEDEVIEGFKDEVDGRQDNVVPEEVRGFDGIETGTAGSTPRSALKGNRGSTLTGRARFSETLVKETRTFERTDEEHRAMFGDDS